jgi:hypothetical protein
MPNPSVPPAGPMMSDNGFPRRIRVDLFTEAERAIYDAHVKVEAVGAHDRLTDAVNLLSKAHEAVADGVEALGLTTPAALPPSADAPSSEPSRYAVNRIVNEISVLPRTGGWTARDVERGIREGYALGIAALRPSADAAAPKNTAGEVDFWRVRFADGSVTWYDATPGNAHTLSRLRAMPDVEMTALVTAPAVRANAAPVDSGCPGCGERPCECLVLPTTKTIPASLTPAVFPDLYPDAAPPKELSEDEFLRAATDEANAVHAITADLEKRTSRADVGLTMLEYIVQETRRLSHADSAPPHVNEEMVQEAMAAAWDGRRYDYATLAEHITKALQDAAPVTSGETTKPVPDRMSLAGRMEWLGEKFTEIIDNAPPGEKRCWLHLDDIRTWPLTFACAAAALLEAELEAVRAATSASESGRQS